MPRVPLRKLKQRQDDNNIEEAADAPETYAVAMGKRIIEARKGKGGVQKQPGAFLGGDIELSQEDSDGISTDGTEDGAKCADAGRAGRGDEEEDASTLHNSGQQHKAKLVIEQEDLDMLKNVELKMQRRNDGRRLRVVVVETGDEEDRREDEVITEGRRLNPDKKFHNERKVQVLVHNVSFENSDQEGATGGGAEWPGPGPTASEGESSEGAMATDKQQADEAHNGAIPKVVRPRDDNDNFELGIVQGRDKQKIKKKLGRRKRRQEQKRVHEKKIRERDLESDESSESKGGWDDGDIRLLPR